MAVCEEATGCEEAHGKGFRTRARASAEVTPSGMPAHDKSSLTITSRSQRANEATGAEEMHHAKQCKQHAEAPAIKLSTNRGEASAQLP